jgi:LysR family nod box-dependent transcriptional activator
MHRSYAHDFSARLPIRLFPIPFRHPGLVQIAQWHRLRRNDPGIQWLIASLRRHASSMVSASPDDATDR